MQPVVNVHCHFMNSNHLSEEYVVEMLKESIPAYAGFLAPNNKEELLTVSNNNFYWKSIIDRAFSKVNLAPKNFIKWTRSLNPKNFWYASGIIDNYIQKGEYLYEKDLPKNSKPIYDIYIPLMMDMETAGSLSKTDLSYIDPQVISGDCTPVGCTPYELQVCEYSMIAARYPWKVFPFVMFNPLNPASLEICQEAIETLGFVGIKMYPAHGFNPDPTKNKDPLVNQRLIDFYEWANKANMPITVHTQYQSMQAIHLEDDDVLKKGYTNVSNWENVLAQYTNLRVNFAHFGGTDYVNKCKKDELTCVMYKSCSEMQNNNCIHLKEAKEKFSRDCVSEITDLSRKYNQNGKIRIFTDVSAHYDENNKLQLRYLKHIKSFLDSDPDIKLMYGTDTPVINMSIDDKTFFDSYNSMIDINKYPKFYSTNALDFIFENRLIPDSYVKFLNKPVFKFKFGTYKSWVNNPPAWIKENNGKYYIY
ncbi:MAG: amidohydrolase family protein [bacterium]